MNYDPVEAPQTDGADESSARGSGFDLEERLKGARAPSDPVVADDDPAGEREDQANAELTDKPVDDPLTEKGETVDLPVGRKPKTALLFGCAALFVYVVLASDARFGAIVIAIDVALIATAGWFLLTAHPFLRKPWFIVASVLLINALAAFGVTGLIRRGDMSTLIILSLGTVTVGWIGYWLYTNPFRAWRNRPRKPKKKTEPVDPAPPPAPLPRGEATGVKERVERARPPKPNKRGKPDTIIWTFRLERYEDGKRLEPIAVEMRGETFSGLLNEGDTVELFDYAAARQLHKTNRIRNITSGVTVVADKLPKGGWFS